MKKEIKLNCGFSLSVVLIIVLVIGDLLYSFLEAAASSFEILFNLPKYTVRGNVFE